jgi:hypothetical protein
VDHREAPVTPVAAAATQRAGEEPRATRGFGPFITFIEREAPDGTIAQWESRRARKQAAVVERPGTWWAPQARGWWIGVLFAVGSVLFGLGAVPGYAGQVGAEADSITFFVGSIFFTVAGFLQYRESVDAGSTGAVRGWSKVFVFRPRQIDWWATGIQLVGTIYFNLSTAHAIQTNIDALQARQHVWRPDLFGSICFLVASTLAWFEVSHGWGSWEPRSLSWWITLSNLTGSVAFGASAIASFVIVSTDQIWNVELSNIGTLLGALCFLVGAVLLLPERTSTG